MANNYVDIMKIVNQGNKMGLSNTITRDNGIPLDLSSVQKSYEDAVIYAATKAIAYVGQPVAVGDKLYIISDTAAEDKFVAADGKEYDNFLKEVGSKTEGDKVTIDLEAGVLKLHGFEDALAGYIPQKKAIYKEGSDTEIDHYELEWVAISAIVEGDGNKITTITSEDGSVTITKKTDTDESLVYDLKVEHPVVPEYAIKKDERAEDATETKYHLTKDGENVDVEIVVPDAYDDTTLVNRIEAVEDKFDIGEKTVTQYVSEQISAAEVGKLTKVIADSVDLENNQVIIEGAVETPVEHVIYMVKVTGVTGDSYKEYMIIGGALVQTGDTTTDLSDYAKTKDVVAKTDFETFQETNTQAIADARTGAVSDVEQKGYALASDVANIYATKQFVGEIPTEAEATTIIGYINEKAQEVLDSATGGSSESAASVKQQLDSYKAANDPKVNALLAEVYGALAEGETEYNYAADSRIDALEKADAAQDALIKNNTTLAQKGVTDAKAANDAIALLTNNPTEELDSVIELINHVKEQGTEVEGIVNRLNGHDTILAGIGGEDQPATVMAAIQAAAYTLPTATADILGGVKSAVADDEGNYAANAVVVDADARMSVHSVSTDTLVNGVEEFILYGGNAGVD